MKKTIPFMRIMGFGLIIGVWSAPTASAETLTATVNKACIFHPESHMAGLLVQEAEQRVKETRSIILPQIQTVTEFGMTDDFDRDTQVLDDGRPVSSTLSLNQALYLGGRGRAAIKGAKHSLKAQKYQSIRQILDVQINAVQAYVELARALDVLKVRKENLKVLEKRQSDASRRFELGAGTKTDIVQAKARIERGAAEIIAARRDISEAMASFYEATGFNPEGELFFPGLPVLPAGIMSAWDEAKAHNPDIKASLAQIDVAETNIKTIQNSLEPELRLLGDVSTARDTAFNGFERDDASLRVRMSVPIFNGGASGARKKESLYARNRTYYQRNLTMNRVLENLRSAWAQYEASRRLVAVNGNLVEVAEKAAIAVKKEADAGFRPNIDILDAQQELLEARLAHTQSRYDEVLAAYVVRAIIGDLGIPNLTHCKAAMPDLTEKPKRPIWERDIIPGVNIKLPKSSDRPRRGPPGK